MEDKRLELIAYGKVQGIGFRTYILIKGRELGVNGYVRNKSNNTIEVVAEGSEKNLMKLKNFVESGYFPARIEKVHAYWSPATREFNNFEIKYTIWGEERVNEKDKQKDTTPKEK